MGSADAVGDTASVAVSTVAGRLYAIIGYISSGSGGSYGGITLTTDGPSVTAICGGPNFNQLSPTIWVGTFVGTGSTVTATATGSTPFGTPVYVVSAVSVIEAAGASGTNRYALNTSDGNTYAWTTQIDSGTPLPGGNLGLAAIALTRYEAPTSIGPSNGETELLDGYKVHPTADGYNYLAGNNLTYQAEYTPNDSGEWAFVGDDYGESQFILEFVNAPDAPAQPLWSYRSTILRR